MDDETSSYLVALARRVAVLEAHTEEIISDADERATHVNGLSSEFRDEMESLEEQIISVRMQLDGLIKSTEKLVRTFKNVTRTASMERLDRKMDAWSPENLATHNDVRRALKKLK